ncbi:MAG: Lrp/AsnC family transcriptional regulator [Chloroflexi bacterium]|nr:Lrp/AsnC family transcriptional regulator [Chloroflexota bacterium]
MNQLIDTHERLLDETGWRILQALQEDARISYAELGRRVGLTPPAVQERVKRLEEAGIIKGYHAQIDLKRVGASVMAFIRISDTGKHFDRVGELLKAMPAVLEMHHVLGEDCYVVKVAVPSVAALESFFREVKPYAHTTTSIVVQSPIQRRTICMDIADEPEY